MLPDMIHLKTVDSTNNYIFENLSDIVDKQVVYSDRQTAGRGRFDRSWVSDQIGNVYLSVLLKPECELSKLAVIPQYMALVVTRVLEKYSIDSTLKWPNDVLVDGKKIAGILTETRVKGNKLNHMVVGVGVNLRMDEEALSKINQEATAVNQIIGHPVGRDIFIHELRAVFFNQYDEVIREGFKHIKDDYVLKSKYLGQKICVKNGSIISEGIAARFSNSGELELSSNGSTILLKAGEIVQIMD